MLLIVEFVVGIGVVSSVVELCDRGVNFVTIRVVSGVGGVESGGGIAMLTLRMLKSLKDVIVLRSGVESRKDVEVEVLLLERRRGGSGVVEYMVQRKRVGSVYCTGGGNPHIK